MLVDNLCHLAVGQPKKIFAQLSGSAPSKKLVVPFLSRSSSSKDSLPLQKKPSLCQQGSDVQAFPLLKAFLLFHVCSYCYSTSLVVNDRILLQTVGTKNGVSGKNV